jgi:predicted amidohydrolase
MTEKIRAGIVQFDVKPGREDTNVAAVEKAVGRLADQGVELVLLPEMWSCGFDYKNLARHALRAPCILCGLGDLAAEKKLCIAGSIPHKTEKGVENTLFFIDKKGHVVSSYPKIHLFTPGGEHEHFTSGGKWVTCDTDFGKIGFMVCYDLRFPELCRTLVLEGSRIVMIAAQWPLSRQAHWETLVKARAIENQVFIMAANRCGKDERQEYAGHSMIISPWGAALAGAEYEETELIAEIDLGEVEKVRSAIPCFTDRRPDVYSNSQS